MAFTLKLQQVSVEDIAGATFQALVAAAWVMFETAQMVWMATHEGPGLAPPEQREQWAREAFQLVAERLPIDSPFWNELQRYLAEEVPEILRSSTPPTFQA
jgi:hypothetical protein